MNAEWIVQQRQTNIKYTCMFLIFSLTRGHLGGPSRPWDRWLEEVNGGAGGGPLLLHRVQGPPQDPGPDCQLGWGGQAVGQQLAEAGLQLKQPEPTAEDWAVSFLVPLIQCGSRTVLRRSLWIFLTRRTFQLDPELPEEGRQEQRWQAESVRDEELPASHQLGSGRRLRRDAVSGDLFDLEWVLGTKSSCATHWLSSP